MPPAAATWGYGVHMTAAQLIWSEELLGYNFGPGHPMAPLRLELTMDLVRSLGLLQAPGLVVAEAEAVDEDLLAAVHEPQYLAAVRAGATGVADPGRGIGTVDNPLFAAMHRASALIAGASVAGARAVWTGAAKRAVNVAGGLHHAMAGTASGFCIYNDCALAIRWLLDQGAQRVLYIDIDAHHGDGVEAAFWDDPRVVTISVHQSGQTLFPGTGFAQDFGGPAAQGSAINLPLPPDVSDGPWLRAIEAVVGPVVADFAPQVIVSQHGADSHWRDPLTQMDISVDAQRAAAALIAGYAEEHSQGRWLATGGGGYDVAATVPRVWTHLVALVAGVDLSAETPTPASWREAIEARGLGPAPTTMGERAVGEQRAWVDGYDPADAVDRAIMATRNKVFPARGLEPMTAG